MAVLDFLFFCLALVGTLYLISLIFKNINKNGRK